MARAIRALDPELAVDIVAINDRPGYAYGPQTIRTIDSIDERAYADTARWLNEGHYDVLAIQHEYGIFGGDAGAHVLAMARETKIPIVTTLHTVLREPTVDQRLVMGELLELSERVVVMSHRAIDLLQEVHGTPPEKVDLVPHGVPGASPASRERIRAHLGVGDGPMILTFGLLSPDKGIQYAIAALPEVLQDFPQAVYVVVGATHPVIRAARGEDYRESLLELTRKLGIEAHVRFIDHFVPTEELVELLSATDIYITPYLNENQITSGTLAYAIGAGKAVISTPYWYAQEVLSEGRGVLAAFRDSASLARAIRNVAGKSGMRAEIEERASAYGRSMLWPEVGQKYLQSLAKAKRDNSRRLETLTKPPLASHYRPRALPKLRLDHLFALTDDTGVLQHATFACPNRDEGYCVDDNARALGLTALIEATEPTLPGVSRLQSVYMAFVLHAFDSKSGRFRNFMSYAREWLEAAGSEDSQGRSVWNLGIVSARCQNLSRSDLACRLVQAASPRLLDTTSPRAWAYGCLGIAEHLTRYPEDVEPRRVLWTLAMRLRERYLAAARPDWPWFEDRLTYANARLPQALIVAGGCLGEAALRRIGLKTLTWLVQVQSDSQGQFSPIGSDRSYTRAGGRSRFDQQPIEATATVSACLAAWRATGDEAWRDEAQRAFDWFLGDNALGVPLCDPTTMGCHDGLHEDRINRNQGAESTVSYLTALLEMKLATEPDTNHALAKAGHLR